MSEKCPSPPPRNWKDIARTLADERDSSKCFELSQELNKALEDEERKDTPIFARNQIVSRDHS